MTTSVPQTSFSGRRLGLGVVALVLVCVLSTLSLFAGPGLKGRWGGLLLLGAAVLLGAYTLVELVRQSRAYVALRQLQGELMTRMEEYQASLIATHEDLRESEARKDALVAGSLDGIVSLDEAQRILEFNPAAERLFRLPREQALRRDFLTLALAASVASEQRQQVVRALQPDTEPRRATRVELTGVRSDGEPFPLELTIIRVTAQNPPRFTIYLRDTSERREVDRMKSEFVSTVSHELRTPLTSIRGSMGLLEGGIMGELPAPVLDMVRIARANTERLIRLINDILDLEKIEAGKLELRLQPLEATEVVEATLGSLSSMAEAAEVVLRAETQGAGQVRADRDRLIQVLTNLVSNAIKFSPREGIVTVRAVATSSGDVRFEVSDQGPGIPLEKRSRLFGKFQQLDSSDTRSKGGTGLGLAISQAIVAQHGGKIDVDSEPGHGATFNFCLAAVKVDPAVLSLVRDESRYNVLVVTANTALSTRLRSLLTGEGYRALRVSSLEEASRLIDGGTPDVLVLSSKLPDGSGLELVCRLRADARTKDLPILMLASPSQADGETLRRLAWVSPHFEEADFLRALRQVVRKPGPARVLVVDDDESTRFLLRAHLERLGVQCDEAENGERAVALARETPPDLIVLDVMLPLLDGFEVVDILRQGKLRGTPLIVFTGRDLSEEEVRQHTLGNTRYIRKDATSDEQLVLAVEELIGGLLRHRAPVAEAHLPS